MTGHGDDQNPPLGRPDFLPMGRQMKALIEAFACDLDLRPDLGADDPARTLICDAKNEFSTALIGQSAGIFGL